MSDAPQPGQSPSRKQKYQARFYRLWGFIAIAVFVVCVLWLLGKVWDAFGVLIAGAVLAFIYAPITNWLNRKLHIPRLPATALGLLAIVIVVIFLIGAVFPPLFTQASEFLSALPGYTERVAQMWDDVNNYLGSETEGVVQGLIVSGLNTLAAQATSLGNTLASNAASGLVSGVSNVVRAIIYAFMAIVVSFWLTKDFPRMESEIANVVGPRRGEDYRTITQVFSRSLSGYLKGLIINSTCTGVITWLGFWALGIPYSGLLGIITAVLNIIPYIGPWIGGALGFIVGLSVGIAPALLSVVVTVVAQQFTDNMVSPKVMQKAVALHPVLVILALLVGGALGDALGMIAAVPLTAALKGVFIYYFEKRTGRQLVSKQGMLFRGEPFCDADGRPRPACDALGVNIDGDKGVPERVAAPAGAQAANTEPSAPAATGATAAPATSAASGTAVILASPAALVTLAGPAASSASAAVPTAAPELSRAQKIRLRYQSQSRLR